MIRGLEAILLFSQNPRKLAQFYRDKVGLKITAEMEMGEKSEEAFEFAIKGCSLYIAPHSKVKGKRTQPERMMFNLEVADIEKAVKDLKKKKVKVIQDIYHIGNYGYVATFADVDGNYFQLVKTRA